MSRLDCGIAGKGMILTGVLSGSAIKDIRARASECLTDELCEALLVNHSRSIGSCIPPDDGGRSQLFYVGWLVTPSVKYTQPVLPMAPVRLTYCIAFLLKMWKKAEVLPQILQKLEIRLQETLSAITIHSNMAVFGFSLCYCPASLLYSKTVEGRIIFTSTHISVLALC